MIKNSEKGFTLVELLAVMSVLAIIALIAVPVVTDTIRKAKDKASLVNAELYLKAAHEAILEYKLDDKEGFYPRTCTVDGKKLLCGNKTIKVKVKGNPPDSGTIVYENEEIVKVELVYGKKTIVNNQKGILVFSEDVEDTSGTTENTLASLCTLADGSTANTIGAKYSCDFGGGERNFYILELGTNPVSNSTLESDEVALILEGNYDTTTQYWCDQSGANPSNNVCAADGLTAKLDEIATAWTKLEREQIGLPSMEQIMVADGKSEDAYTDYPSLSNAWLYNWPNNADYGNSAPHGYWSSSPRVGDSFRAWYVSF